MRYLLSRHLNQFVMIYDRGSLRAASDSLGVTQPALSKSLRQFEDLLDVMLFDRNGGKLVPTPFADTLRLRANIILKEAEFATREIEQIKQNFYKPLVCSAGPVWLSEILPNVLPAIYEKYPQLKIGVRLEAADVAVPKIYRGDSDLYFGLIPPMSDYPELQATPVLTLQSVLFARKGHPIHSLNLKQKLNNLFKYPWSGFGLWEGAINISIKNHLQTKGLNFSGFTYGVESLLGLARIGQLTDHIILSVDAVSSSFAEYDLVEVEGLDLQQSFASGMICRSSLMAFQPVASMLQILRQSYADTSS